MTKIIASAICGCLLSFNLYGQAGPVTQVLGKIEQNNSELKAYQAFIESQQLEYNSSNNLPDPQAGMYYLPIGTHTTGDYKEFQISQSFEFPTVYAARNKLIGEQEDQLQLEYGKLRQKILLSARQYCQELIYLKKRDDIEQLRVQQAKKIFDQVRELYKKEQVGILELNKAKIAWMRDQFVLEQIENERRNVLLSLKSLNGGDNISLNQSAYPNNLVIASADKIWQEKMSTDPFLRVLKEKEAVSFQMIKLEKNKILPNLTAGFNYQGVPGQYYSGIYGGFSIPLWNSRNKVKMARAQHDYQQTYTKAKTNELYADFQEGYNRYKLLFKKYVEYKNTLYGLSSEALLLQAYTLGEISFMEYYIELQFYRQAYDKMLEIEHDLNQLRAVLLKHEL